MGTRRAKTASGGAFGPFWGTETHPRWGLARGELRFGPSGLRYGQFWSRTAGRNPGPNWAREHHPEAKLVKTRQTDNPHMARVDFVHERGQWAPLAPFSEPPGPVLSHFGSGPIQAKIVHSGQPRRNVGGKHGAEEDL